MHLQLLVEQDEVGIGPYGERALGRLDAEHLGRAGEILGSGFAPLVPWDRWCAAVLEMASVGQGGGGTWAGWSVAASMASTEVTSQ